MTYQSHLVWALAASAALYPLPRPASLEEGLVLAAWIILGALGGLLPDIDHPQSKIGRLVPFLPTILFKTTGHRGATHSIFGVVISGALTYAALYAGLGHAWAWLGAQALMVGYVAHLAGDFITNRGVPLMWPLAGRMGISVTKTGSSAERGITAVVAVFGMGIGAASFMAPIL